MGSRARFARAYPHTSRGSSVKLAIRIGLAAELLGMCSKATKHGVAFRIGLAAKLLRMRSKATNDNFSVRIGSAAKLLRKCSERKRNCIFFFSSILRYMLSSFASEPL